MASAAPSARISSSGPRLEAQRQPAAEVEVGGVADAAVEDVDGLRQQHAQQAVADRRARCAGATSTGLPGATVFQRSTERKIGAGR